MAPVSVSIASITAQMNNMDDWADMDVLRLTFFGGAPAKR